MRTSISSLALTLDYYGEERGNVPEDVEHIETLYTCIQLLNALGTVMRAFPEELRGNEIWTKDYALHRAEELHKAMRGVGALTASLADTAFVSLFSLQSLHEAAVAELAKATAGQSCASSAALAGANGVSAAARCQ